MRGANEWVRWRTVRETQKRSAPPYHPVDHPQKPLAIRTTKRTHAPQLLRVIARLGPLYRAGVDPGGVLRDQVVELDL